MSAENDRKLQRPFYLMVVVWGEQYRNYFLEFCLPSLLSPRNIPALGGRRPAKFLLATTAEDRDIIQATTIFRELEKHAEPVFIELPPKEDSPYWLYSIVGHKMCCDVTARDKAYRIFVCPDSIFSDGAVERLHEVALDGAEAVLSLVTPLTRTDIFFKMLAQMGLLPERSARDTGVPIVLSTRQMVALAMRAMHGLSRVNEWEAPYFCGYAAAPWWKVPREPGGVMHGLFWNLLLVDHAAVQHDGSILDARGFDGDYLMRTIGNLESIYFVRDSDELYAVSWASVSEPPLRDRYGEFGRGVAFRISACNPVFNSFQRDTLFMPTAVHASPLGGEWEAVEQKTLRTLLTWLDPPGDIERYSRRLPANLQNFAGFAARIAVIPLPWWRRNHIAWAVCLRIIIPVMWQWLRIREFLTKLPWIWHRAVLALRGDPAAIQWWRWHTKRIVAKVLRRPFGEPSPGARI
jgi:hypothetical protein